MIRSHPRPLRSRRDLAGGFSLVELLIAMVLSSFVILAVVALYGSIRENWVQQDEVAKLQENMRIGMSLIERTIRQGNYKRIPTARDQNQLLVTDFSFSAVVGTDGGSTGNDTLQITFNGSSRPPVGGAVGATDSIVVDCAGAPVGAIEVRNNRFQVTNDADGRPWLACSRPGFDDTLVLLIPDVEQFHVQYGTYADESRTVAYYQPWSAGLDPGRIVAIRVGLLFRSNAEVAPAPSSGSYSLLGQTFGPYDDRYLRTALESTIVVRSSAL